jgi:CBS domain-containing protein
VHLSSLLDHHLDAPDHQAVGKVDDVIARLRGDDYPLVTGLVAKVGGRRVFVPTERIAELGADRVVLAKPKVDLRAFERREGEVLLRQDILGHRLIDVGEAELIRASDVELVHGDEGWTVSRVDTRPPSRLFGLLRSGGGHPSRDWKAFEPLVGHAPTSIARRRFGRLRRLKPAQIADLLENASEDEGDEILEAVHIDPELEADVFEELEPDTANRLFADRTDLEVADVLAHMRADDAADAIAELPQRRREPVLELLPPANRAKVMTLLGFNESSAGGLMGIDVLTGPSDASVEEALRRIRLAENLQPEVLVTFHAVDAGGRLVGTVSVIDLLHADPDARLVDVMDADPVRVPPGADVVDVALLMTDYNLLTIAVVEDDDRLVGVITVDDLLEATLPEDWRRREPPPRPGPLPADEVARSGPMSDGGARHG